MSTGNRPSAATLACLTCLAALLLPAGELAAQRATVLRGRTYSSYRSGYVVVADFANECGPPDDDWIGVALGLLLEHKLSRVPEVELRQYTPYRQMTRSGYLMPLQGESAQVRAERMAGSVGRGTLVLGGFAWAGTDLEVDIYTMHRGDASPTMLPPVHGGPEVLGEMLDRAMPGLLEAVLPPGVQAGTDWRGSVPTESSEALQWFARGVLAEEQDTDQADLCFQSAVHMDPSFLAARWAMISVARRQRDPEGALEHANAVAAALPDDVQVRIARAVALMGVGKYLEAAEEYQLCTRLNPRLGRSVNQQIVRCYSRAGELDKALAWAEGLLADDPTSASLLTLLGGVRLERGEHEKAIDCFRRAAEASPDDWRPHWELGQCYAQLGRLEEAAAQYRAGLEAEPKAITLVRALADVYEQEGDVEEAIRQWEQVLNLSPPGSGAALEAEQRLAALNGGG